MKVPRTLGRGFLLSAIAVVTLGLAMSGVAVASHATAARHHGRFACKATGVQIAGHTLAVANPRYSPCYDKLARVNKAGKTLNHILTLGVVTSRTHIKHWRLVRAGTLGTASARTAKAVLKLGATTIKIGTATSSATNRCVAKGGKLGLKQQHTSDVVYIFANGQKHRPGTKTEKIPLGPLGTIYVNRVHRSGHTLMVRAVQIDLLGKKAPIILAQSQVSYTGRPCATS